MQRRRAAIRVGGTAAKAATAVWTAIRERFGGTAAKAATAVWTAIRERFGGTAAQAAIVVWTAIRERVGGTAAKAATAVGPLFRKGSKRRRPLQRFGQRGTLFRSIWIFLQPVSSQR